MYPGNYVELNKIEDLANYVGAPVSKILLKK